MHWDVFAVLYVSMVVLLSVFGLGVREYSSGLTFGTQGKDSVWRIIVAVALLTLLPALVMAIALPHINVLIAIMLAGVMLVVELCVINKLVRH
jgi:hypothetical protein